LSTTSRCSSCYSVAGGGSRYRENDPVLLCVCVAKNSDEDALLGRLRVQERYLRGREFARKDLETQIMKHSEQGAIEACCGYIRVGEEAVPMSNRESLLVGSMSKFAKPARMIKAPSSAEKSGASHSIHNVYSINKAMAMDSQFRCYLKRLQHISAFSPSKQNLSRANRCSSPEISRDRLQAVIRLGSALQIECHTFCHLSN
jgi:hypothetical protein